MRGKRRERIIFSNLEYRENCHEDCNNPANCDCDYLTIEDERANLNVQVDGIIIGLVNAGLWNGRSQGYMIYGNSIRNILSSVSPKNKWYSDGYNILGESRHHDGINYTEYRLSRPDRDYAKLLQKIINGEEVSRNMINYYTQSLHPYVANVYGWK